MRRTLLATIFVAGLGSGSATPQETVSPPADDLAWVEKRVQEWQPTPAERKFDQIAWVNDLLEALSLGKKHGRPVFLFTYDGPSMQTGRC